MLQTRWHKRCRTWLYAVREAAGKQMVLLLLRGGAYSLAWRVYLRLGNGKEK